MTGGECLDEVCLTCGDIAVEAVVVGLAADDLATVRVSGARSVDLDGAQGNEEISVALVDARLGDTVLVHAKEAIAVVGRAGGRR
jgi:hydrogenase expression/formation protein HypC